MIEKKEIGGYFELEVNNGSEYHDLLSFNSARNCLQYIVREKKIKEIYIPMYLCLVIEETLKNEKVEIGYYHIDNNFKPILTNLNKDEYIYIVNFFGLLSNTDIMEIKNNYPNIIVDNTHAFYTKPVDGVDTIYNCRKYFGVPDGAYLSTDMKAYNYHSYSKASSINRIRHLFGRFEADASSYYNDFLLADKSFDDQDIELMSDITHNMLKAIDYDNALNKRNENMRYLFDKLNGINNLDLKEKNINFMYPLLIDNGEKIKNKLLKNKIYIPKLWPGLDKFDLNDFENNLFNNLLPLPIDHRYGIEDMNKMIELIKEE